MFGVTVHEMSLGIDEGNIIFTNQPDINKNDKYETINCKSIQLGTKKVIESIITQNYENYIIHVAYDHIDSLDYINQNMNHKMIIHKVDRKSDKNVFFDLYCNDIKDKINDGWIMFLDDDNYFIHPDCLKIINMNLKEKIVVWSFLRPDKLIPAI